MRLLKMFGVSLLKDEMSRPSVQVCQIRINGMTCTSCLSIVELALQAIQGMLDVQVALTTEEDEVQYNSNIINYKHILEAIKDTTEAQNEIKGDPK